MEPSESFRVIEESPYYFLTQDEDGYALWSVVGDDADDPVLTFPPGDGALDAARSAFRRETHYGRWSRILLVAAIVAAPIWLVSLLIGRWMDLFGSDTFPGVGRDFQPARLQVWLGFASSVANTVFIIAVGLSVLIWLHRRYHREG